MSDNRKPFLHILRREALTLLFLLLAGVLLLPIAIYMVGGELFGAYSGSGFGDFYRDIHGDLREGQSVVIFLLLSPYLVWQLLPPVSVVTSHVARPHAPRRYHRYWRRITNIVTFVTFFPLSTTI